MESEVSAEPYWYVLRDLKRPNAKKPAYKVLGENPMLKDKLFVPMKQTVVTESGKRVHKYVPYMQDLVFVRERRKILDPIVKDISGLQYRYVRGGKQYEVMKVGAEEMDRFIQAVKEIDNVEYYSCEEVSEAQYNKSIRIIGGTLDGYEGRLMSKQGSKTKRLIITLPECNLAAAIKINPELIQLVK